MPVDNEGRFYRSPKDTSSGNSPSQRNAVAPRQASNSSREMGIAESIGVILAFVVCVALLGVAAYFVWIGAVWVYDKVVKVIRFIYENRDLIVGLLILIVVSAIRSFFD